VLSRPAKDEKTGIWVGSLQRKHCGTKVEFKMIARLRVLAGVAAVLLLSACAGGPVADKQDPYTQAAFPAAAANSTAGDLRVGPLDLLEIRVFGVTELSGDYQVDPEGNVKFPLIGVVAAKDLTSFELSKVVEKRLAESYLQNPQVTIRVKETFGQMVTIEGAVTKPGQYPVRNQMTLLRAIALSGGTTETANVRKVVIFRNINGKRSAAGFDLSRIRRGAAEDPAIFAEDIVVIDGSSAKSSYRELIRSIPALGVFVGLM
jgi:polysaccharide biosynthesis/export protein